MPDDEFSGFEDLSGEPLEVRLVGDTTRCRGCGWFWRPAPYGPYPSYDFSEDFPADLQLRDSRQYKNGDRARTLSGVSRKQAVANPQLLHGCRKSPLMTIGINPNLTGFWPGTDGARWTYPLFTSFRRCAYYYRHRTVHQESFPLDFVRRHLRQDSLLKASGDGRVKKVCRAKAARRMTVTLAYADGEEEIEQTWDAENHFVLLFDAAPSGETQFRAGEVVGGFLDLPDGTEVPVEQNVVGYYLRVIPILEQVSAYLRSRGELPELQMAEDFSQLDMVACPSPGWGSAYEIDKDEVERRCVVENGWVVRQLVQSQPKVIVFSGRSAFNMFHRMFKPFITPDLHTEMDVYGLMKYTARDPHYLDVRTEIEGRAYHLRARLLIGPHFSYDDNFVPHARMSKEEWTTFGVELPAAVAELTAEAGRVTEPNRDGYRGIRLDGLDAFQSRHSQALIHLMRKHYDASAMIGQGIAQEILLGNVVVDGSHRHLARAEGPCHFCVNGQWSFPEGCAYGKPDEERYPDGFLEKVVVYVTSRMQGS